jgi:hypothetical protein
MHAVIARVSLKPGHEQEALAMIGKRGVPMVQGMTGSVAGYWAGTLADEPVIQHSFWLFETGADAAAPSPPSTRSSRSTNVHE